MKTKYLLIGLATVLVTSTAVAYVVYSITKRKYSPKMHAGELYIDHTEGDGNPSIYLNITNSNILSGKDCLVTVETKHIRK